MQRRYQTYRTRDFLRAFLIAHGAFAAYIALSGHLGSVGGVPFLLPTLMMITFALPAAWLGFAVAIVLATLTLVRLRPGWVRAFVTFGGLCAWPVGILLVAWVMSLNQG